MISGSVHSVGSPTERFYILDVATDQQAQLSNWNVEGVDRNSCTGAIRLSIFRPTPDALEEMGKALLAAAVAIRAGEKL